MFICFSYFCKCNYVVSYSTFRVLILSLRCFLLGTKTHRFLLWYTCTAQIDVCKNLSTSADQGGNRGHDGRRHLLRDWSPVNGYPGHELLLYVGHIYFFFTGLWHVTDINPNVYLGVYIFAFNFDTRIPFANRAKITQIEFRVRISNYIHIRQLGVNSTTV